MCDTVERKTNLFCQGVKHILFREPTAQSHVEMQNLGKNSNTRPNKRGNGRIDVTLRRVRVTIVAVEKPKVLHIPSVCSLSYPECKAHAPHYIVICGLSGCTIVYHIIS
jgi:hypothetical protein